MRNLERPSSLREPPHESMAGRPAGDSAAAVAAAAGSIFAAGSFSFGENKNFPHFTFRLLTRTAPDAAANNVNCCTERANTPHPETTSLRPNWSPEAG